MVLSYLCARIKSMTESHKVRGVTLSEVVLALGVLAIVGLTVIGVFTKLMGSQSKSSHATVGRFLMESVAERVSLSGPPDWGVTGDQTESVYIHSQDQKVTFTYRIPSYFALKKAPVSNPMGTLYFVNIEIEWWGGDDRIEVGKTKLATSRVIYVED